jgi:glycosyltransferase involved in cell wall biosynthesis
MCGFGFVGGYLRAYEQLVPRELLVVIPVYNEDQCIGQVLKEWKDELDRSAIDYGILLIDDGSSDATPMILEQWRNSGGGGRIEVASHANRGHGQTCLEGYRIACERGIPWVFQIDSDGQCDPAFFAALWAERQGRDVVYGYRARRKDGLKRVLASILVKAVLRASARVRCVDANVPYRLMRTENLRPLVDSIPSDFDLANIALAVQIKRANWREASVPIVFRPRMAGEASVPLTRFARKACELAVQVRQLPVPAGLK